MNAGMFDTAGSPIGLYVENRQELHAISTTDAPGNFHLKPNGVFWVDAASDPHVMATDAYLAAKPEAVWATQSGPMLVVVETCISLSAAIAIPVVCKTVLASAEITWRGSFATT